MTSFVEVTEYGDGENWVFWIQLEGNEEQLAYLDGLMWDNYFKDTFSVDMNCVETEEVVDALVRYAVVGDYWLHSKLKGKLKLPREPKKKTTGWFKKYFYRNLHEGRIERHIK